ncbi:hypothetical protein Tco_0706957 [Tanacetum coccineum]|uniref:Uncharacterized protein n=1 Tax=Tanacetum coccineum TaxID=301880 RepID=A0ABQ4YAG3_9ASTR
MVSFRLLHSHLKLLSNNDLKGTRTECGFKRAFVTLFGQDVETFTGTMFLNMDQLEKQLDKEEFQEIGSMAAFKVLEAQFQKFIKPRTCLDDEYVIMTRKYFLEYTQLEVQQFRDTLIQYMESVKKSIDKRALHKKEYDSRVNERQMQIIEEKVDSSKALDASLVDTESRQHHSEQPEFNNEREVDQNAEQCHDTQNEQLHKEKEHLKQTYKDLFDYIKKTREKVFEIVALKNELRKLIGNSVNTKFAKPSVLGKPVLQPHRNHSVVRQPTAFKSERPRISKPQFASQVDVNNDLSKPVTTHYLPKKRKYAFTKPHHVIASSESRNSAKNMPRFSSNNMVHNHYLEEARKKTQEKGRNSESSVMPSARSQSTANDYKPKPRINHQKSRNWPASKTSCATIKTVSIAEHSRNSRNFSNSKHFVCSTCKKCVFNANHDHCVTKFLNEVNSRAKVPSHKTTTRYKLIEQISVAKKPERQIPTGHRFSIKNTSAMHEKTTSPSSCLKWKQTGRIFKTISLSFELPFTATSLDGSKPKNIDEHQERSSKFFKNFFLL